MAKNTPDSSKVTVWFIVGFLVLVTAGVIIAGAISGGSSANPDNSNFVSTTAPAIVASDWARGNRTASVSLIEYGDFECPACAAYQPLVDQLVQKYGDRVLFIFRHFPLYTVHPDAGISAQAAEAAGIQGKFWDMHDLLYSKQNDWATVAPGSVVADKFNGYAQSLGLDVAKFDADINSPVVTSKIQADVTGGNTASIDHTPTFFVNLKQIPNPSSYADFEAVIDQALGIAPSSTSTGLPDVVTTTSTKQ